MLGRLFFASAGDDHQLADRDGAGQLLQEREALGIGPLHIFEQQQRGLGLATEEI